VCSVVVARPPFSKSFRERCIQGLRQGMVVETLCHDIYPAQPITTVSLAANTSCHGSHLVVHVNRAINDRPVHTAECHLLSVVQAATMVILSISKPSISQWSQIKEDTVEPSVLAQDSIL